MEPSAGSAGAGTGAGDTRLPVRPSAVQRARPVHVHPAVAAPAQPRPSQRQRKAAQISATK
eukprot:7252960-Pyramimonas_sp.AAC.1